ncbi:FMN-binding domain-containing protein [Paenibacillus sophorae]|uniref:FMN-binding domain-containing protein n=1 Tax=Paenibacillus sophorae TaxID=1333845 RepID=A0A1H8IYW0_9BACL|nr:FMN-binding protein [Paenibacillus sophorae]QWU16135.1 FMN-binding protein [Paenibacillus sophorae]SEN73539.1 FMN-binding domain-containing protein [Paenibacillus sophorae]
MAKMKRKWVVLCSSAVAAVYATGYFITDTQASVQPPPPVSYEVNGQQSELNGGQSSVNSGQANGTSTDSVQTERVYTDGTYTGMGSNRFGSIEVQITISNDQITDVEISNFTMSYPESDVAGLPDEVLSIQSAEVANVSGATYSTRAFKDAVQEALSQAQNA